jgi:NADH-quinone oxidoreductase subunit M
VGSPPGAGDGRLWLVVSLSSLALPGLNGFVGEFPILLGTFQVSAPRRCSPRSVRCWPRCTCCGPTSACSTARSRAPTTRTRRDLKPREIGVLAPLVVAIVAIGLYPKPLFDLVTPSVDRVLVEVEEVEDREVAR